MNRLLFILFCVVLSSVNWARSESVADTVYVVDRLSGSSANEFVDLESATRALCSRQGGRVVINRNAPLVGGDLTIGCDVVLEAADTGRANVLSTTDIVISSHAKLVINGLRFSGEGQLRIEAQGLLDIKKTAILMPAIFVASSTFRFEANEISDVVVELVGETSDAATVISGNRGMVTSGKLTIKTMQGLDRVLEIYENTFDSLVSNFCGRSLSVNLNNNIFSEATLGLRSNLVKTRIFGGRMGSLRVTTAQCESETDEIQTADITFMQATVGRFEAWREPNSILALSLNTDAASQFGAFKLNWGENGPRSRLSLVARGTKFNGDFSWTSAGDVTLELEDAEIGANANITNGGSVSAKFKGVQWKSGITINTLPRQDNTRPSLDVTQLGGYSGSHFEIATNGNGRIFAKVIGLNLGVGARFFAGRRIVGTPISNTRNDASQIVVRDTEFTKPGQYLQIAGLDGDFTIENNRFNVDIAEFGYAGLRVADHFKGRVDVIRNEFLVSARCDLQCTALRAQNTSGLTVKENQFFVYAKNGHGVELQHSIATLVGNTFTGGTGHGSLIEATNQNEFDAHDAILIAENNKINATGLVSVQLTGPLFASFTGNTFSGSGVFNDGPGSDFATEGGLVQDPILNNAGLHDKSVTTSIDFDGNGCRDIPRDANHRDAGGQCAVSGKIKPSLP